MIIYKDIISGDEIISDSFPMKEAGDGAVYEVECSMISLGGENFDTGANASAEEIEEGPEDKAVQVNNVVHSFRLQQTTFDKKSYLSHLKGYMKNIKQSMQANGADDAAVKAFETGAAAHAKKIAANFKDYDCFTGESMNPDGMVVLMNYREDGVTPFLTVWKHGLKEEKV